MRVLRLFLWSSLLFLLCCTPYTATSECERNHHCATGQTCQNYRCLHVSASEIRLKQLICDHFFVGQSVRCEIQGEGFLSSDKAWIGCLLFDAKDSKRIDDTRWELRGRWSCECGTQYIGANIRGNKYETFNSGRSLEGVCGCQPDRCTMRGMECGSFGDERGVVVECGPCPAYSTCQDGRCVGVTKFSTRCQGDALHNTDGRGKDESLRKDCAQGTCVTRRPFAHDLCQEDLPPFSCNAKPDGTYCFGKALVTCVGGAQQSAQTCEFACQPTPSPDLSVQGQARCFVRPRDYAMLQHKASGLCAEPTPSLLSNAHLAHLVLRPCQKENPSFYWKLEKNGLLRHASQLCAQQVWNFSGYGRCSTVRLTWNIAQPAESDNTWSYHTTTKRLQIGDILQMVPYTTPASQGTFLHFMPQASITKPSQAEWLFVVPP